MMKKCVLMAIVVSLLSGCGTISHIKNDCDELAPYGGVAQDFDWLEGPSYNNPIPIPGLGLLYLISIPFILTDIPLSIAADTIILPYSLPKYIVAEVKDWQKRHAEDRKKQAIARMTEEERRQWRREEAAPIIDLLENYLTSDNVKKEAAQKLGEIGCPSALPVLELLLKYDDDSVRRASVHAIGRLRDVDVIPVLIDVLESPSSSSGMCVAALGEIRDIGYHRIIDHPRLIDALVVVVENHPPCRATVAQALGNTKSQEAVPILIDMLQTPGNHHDFTVYALKKLAGKDFRTASEWLAWWKTVAPLYEDVEKESSRT